MHASCQKHVDDAKMAWTSGRSWRVVEGQRIRDQGAAVDVLFGGLGELLAEYKRRVSRLERRIGWRCCYGVV